MRPLDSGSRAWKRNLNGYATNPRCQAMKASVRTSSMYEVCVISVGDGVRLRDLEEARRSLVQTVRSRNRGRLGHMQEFMVEFLEHL